MQFSKVLERGGFANLSTVMIPRLFNVLTKHDLHKSQASKFHVMNFQFLTQCQRNELNSFFHWMDMQEINFYLKTVLRSLLVSYQVYKENTENFTGKLKGMTGNGKEEKALLVWVEDWVSGFHNFIVRALSISCSISLFSEQHKLRSSKLKQRPL